MVEHVRIFALRIAWYWFSLFFFSFIVKLSSAAYISQCLMFIERKFLRLLHMVIYSLRWRAVVVLIIWYFVSSCACLRFHSIWSALKAFVYRTIMFAKHNNANESSIEIQSFDWDPTFIANPRIDAMVFSATAAAEGVATKTHCLNWMSCPFNIYCN